MVSSTLLCQVGGLNDVDGMVWELPAPYDKYLLISWYHDTQYGSDEYGCRSLPNIFHIWLLDETQLTGQTPPNVPHINVFGQECHPYVLFRTLQFIARQGKFYLLLGGYDYSDKRKFLSLIDITNITSPVVVKTIKDDTGTGDWWNQTRAVYNPDRDELIYVDITGNVRRLSFSAFLNATKFSDGEVIKATGINPAVLGAFAWDSQYILVRVDQYVSTGTPQQYFGLYDRKNGTLTDISAFSFDHIMAKYALKHTMSGTTLASIDLIDKSTRTVSKTLTLNIQNIGSPYDPMDLGDGIILIGNRGGTAIAIIKYDGSYYVYTSPIPMYQGRYRKGSVYALKHYSDILTTGELYKITLDTFYYVKPTTSPDTFQLVDQNGNPVANKTIYLVQDFGDAFSDGYTTVTTDANGYFKVPYGVWRIAGVF